ncbi:MAG: FtsW/RodA/SpoVE family cell cycle protein [Butyrivibrio sp.]|nr:FtsW/RodA/SpoVE family cell cycle protein [Butyrivibrio sp.]
MVRVLLRLSKYVLIFLMLIYAYLCFSVNAGRRADRLRGKYLLQSILTLLIFSISSAIIIYYNPSVNSVVFFALEFVYLALLAPLYGLIHPNSSRLLTNNTEMLLALGFIMVLRLSPANAFKQFVIVLVGTAVAFFVPPFMRKRGFLIKSRYFLAAVGIALLGVTLVLGKTTWGANISVDIAGFSFQPSEFVKLIYVLFAAAVLTRAQSFKNVAVSAVVAAAHVLVLAVSNDLGAALIFFVVYLAMLYVGTGQIRYIIAGTLAGFAAAVFACNFFSHVKTRVAGWRDPWSIIDGGGYQITQSLFAIGTGGWFGMGLYQGLPGKIPVAVKDFVFAAISEEYGMLFAICVILVCFSCFIGIMKIASQSRDMFYKLIAVGFGVLYIFQCFLTIGGVTKFIPLTGVTLPFVSYGGSSILCSLIMFAVVQSVFILVKENEENGEEKNGEA